MLKRIDRNVNQIAKHLASKVASKSFVTSRGMKEYMKQRYLNHVLN